MDLFNRSPQKKLKKYAKKNVSDTITLGKIEQEIDEGIITTQEEVDEKIIHGRKFVEDTFSINKSNNKTVFKPMTIDGKPKEGYLYFKFEGHELYLVESNGKKVYKSKTPLKIKM